MIEKDTTKDFNTNECLIYNLTEKVTYLEGQIEKMKCCSNCKYSFSNGLGCMQSARRISCDNYKLWELAE